ncbi:MAG: oligosaccharide flippase family protein [Myxococcales bacterium]|nr:oligosaccharide flippase family protein [Myxococcales bacterium]
MPGATEIKTDVNRGLAWIGMASSLVGVLDFLAILILLRYWITPDEYGVATLAIAVFPILDQVTDLGLSAAVIQRDRKDDDIISSVFWINLTTAATLFVLLWLLAPPIATGLFDDAVIGSMMIAYGTKLLWQNVYFIPVALMKRELRFKELSVIRVIANLTEFAGKIGFAAAGFGIWAFVLGPMGRVLVTGIGAQICHPWRPRFVLKLRATWDHAAFGMKASASQILFSMYSNADYLIVGVYFSKTAVGIYRLAYEVVLEPVRMISNVVVDIAFPAFAKLRHDRPKLIAQFVSFTRMNLVTVMLYSAVVFVAAEEVVTLFFPKYGLAPVDAVRILLPVAILRSLSYVLPPLLDGVGHPSRTLIYMIVASVVLPLFFVLSAKYLGPTMGFESVALAWAVGYPIAFIVLLLLVTYTIDLKVGTFVRQVIGVPLCIVAATVAGEGTKWALAGAPLAVRMVGVTVVIVGVAGVLLAYTQGLSPRRARAAMRGEPPPVDLPPDPAPLEAPAAPPPAAPPPSA